jgi:hypothetical protein
MSNIINESKFLFYFPKMSPDRYTSAIQALVVAIYEITCLTGSILIIGFEDKLQRRREVLLSLLIMSVRTAIQASCFELEQDIGERPFTGIGKGVNTSSVPVW